jgi:hypothetical protein
MIPNATSKNQQAALWLALNLRMNIQTNQP